MEFANNPEELNELEAKHVTLKELYDENCYNLKTGGNQNIVYSESMKQKNREWHKGKKYSEETKKKKSASLKDFYKKNPEVCRGKNAGMYGKHHSEETKIKIRESNRGKKHKPVSDDTKNKLSVLLSGKNNPMYGKSIYSVWVNKYGIEEANKKYEEWKKNSGNGNRGKATHSKGKIWVSNSIISKLVYPNEIPEGFVPGRVHISKNKYT